VISKAILLVEGVVVVVVDVIVVVVVDVVVVLVSWLKKMIIYLD
jgi:hypothetical protein